MSEEQKMSEEQREAEEIRQEKIEAGVGKIVPGAGRRGTPRRMDQMVSVRLSGDLIARLKIVARQRGTTLSELVREGAELIVEDEYASAQQRVVFRISGAQQAIHETISERTVATH
jgi:predicted DNA-binding protein